MPETLLDHVTLERLNDDKLPEGITVKTLKAFCKAHNCNFFSLKTVYVGGDNVARTQDVEGMFRVATNDFPARGVNVSFLKVRGWLEDGRKIDDSDVPKLCKELPILEARLRAAGLHKTARLLGEAVKQVGWEAVELREHRAVSLGEAS